jgi:S-formylglutathione hydrolase FrmB
MQSFTRIHNVIKVFVLITLTVGVFPASGLSDPPQATIIDARHYSNVFGETRNYRLFLPPGYFENPGKRYPVIYFFHGWSQRYFGSSNPYGDFDKGDENGGDNIANFVATHEVIVVKADGYNRSQDEKYYVRPYNVTPVETYRQFPIYFPELVEHIDTHYRTIADREHRGISGLSMGGFMTFWIGGKYPHLLTAAGNFCGSPEFEVGPKDLPVEYRHLDMYKNYGGMNVRLHYGDKDFIRGYHDDLNRVWPQLIDNYSFKMFDAAHSTCGMGEMLGFILKTFDKPPAKPARWHHTDVYPEFSVWDYKVMTDRTVPGFTTIENVDARGFRSSVREFLPDGELLPSVRVSVRTAPLYEKNQPYIINDFNAETLISAQRTIVSDGEGRLLMELDGASHEIGINRKSDKANITIATSDVQGSRWANTGDDVIITLKVINKGLTAAKDIRATVTATRPTAVVSKPEVRVGSIGVNESASATVNIHVKADTIQVERFKVTFRDASQNAWVDYFEIPLEKKLSEIKEFDIADGKTFTVVKSGNGTETVLLGNGNGDGIANPGESIVILVRDGNKLWRADLRGKDPYINPFGISLRRSDNWSSFDYVGGSAKYDVPVIASDCPQDYPVEFVVEYWQPEYPMHIIKQGVVKFKVKGKDTTPPALASMYATGDNVLHVKLYDGAKIQNVKATLTDEKDSTKTFISPLTDDGKGGDRAKGDRVFSQKMPGQTFGIFKVVIEAEDTFGNRTEFKPEETVVLH